MQNMMPSTAVLLIATALIAISAANTDICTESTGNKDEEKESSCGCSEGTSRPAGGAEKAFTAVDGNKNDDASTKMQPPTVSTDMVYIPPPPNNLFTMGYTPPPKPKNPAAKHDWVDYTPNPLDKEMPARQEKISDGFLMDRFPVSVGDYWAFVEANQDFIGTSYEFNDTYVFQGEFASLDFTEGLGVINGYSAEVPWWVNVKGVHWNTPPIRDLTNAESSFRHDIGRRSPPDSDRLNFPVVHVSYLDAEKFCNWRDGARLPTEIEWEYAARGGKENRVYPWGNVELKDGKYRANYFQGTFPSENIATDGHIFVNERGSFPYQNKFGLEDMVGNVWEWTTSDWDKDNKVKRGGSFLCEKGYCYRYRNAARSFNTPDSTASNLGFRCIKEKS